MATDNFDFEIYNGKSFKDLCKEVYERSEAKKDQLDTLVSDLRSLIKTPNDAQVFIPRIKELMEVGIKNDEQMIKLGAVVQRIQSTQLEVSGGEGVGLSEAEREQLKQASIRAVGAVKTEVDKKV